MSRKPSHLALVAVSLVCILILAACSNSTPFLRYIVISPSSATIPAGTTQQFTATGYYSNGNTTPGLSVSWASSSPSVATIDPTAGVATGVAAGTTSITATAFGVTSSPATLTVVSIVSIAVTPANQTVTSGATVQYQATGTYSNPNGGAPIVGTTGDLTAQVTWATVPTTLASFSTSTPGLATAGSTAGTGTVTATLGSTTGQTNLTVTSGPVSLVITPAAPTIAISNTVAFTAQEKWSDNSLHPPSGAVTWASATPTVVEVNAAQGIGLGIATGSSTITATEGSLTGNATVTVVAANARYAYVSNNGSNTIQWYSVNLTTSPYLTSQGTLATSGPGPAQTVIHPSGQFLYYADAASTVWVTTINPSTGALTATAFPGQVGGASGNANFTAIDPYGRFLYISNDVNGTIYGFQINQADGSLTPMSGSPFTANLNYPECLIIDHTGTYLYATNEGNSTISAYTIDQTSGALTPLSTPTFNLTPNSGPYLGGQDPSGTHLYVANYSANTVSGFSIGTGGVLTSVGADVSAPGATNLENIDVDPSGTHIYVVDAGTTDGQVYGFNIGSGGVIGSAIAGTPIATGAGPFGGIAIDPTGVLLAVENGLGDTISLYTIGSGGTLTSQSPVNTGSTPLFVTFYNAP